MNYSSASQDMQLLKILHMKSLIETIAEHSDNSVGKQIVIAIGGCCDRIGTTTQALQLVKYLQFMGHRACYIQYNHSGYDFVGRTKDILQLEDGDNDIGRVTFANVDMYAAPEHIAEIKAWDMNI